MPRSVGAVVMASFCHKSRVDLPQLRYSRGAQISEETCLSKQSQCLA